MKGSRCFNDPDSRVVADKRPIGEVKGQMPIKEKIKDGRAIPREPGLGGLLSKVPKGSGALWGKSITLQDSRK